MRDLSHSKLLICFVNLLVVVVTRKCVGWEKKVLFWGESWVQGRGKGNGLKKRGGNPLTILSLLKKEWRRWMLYFGSQRKFPRICAMKIGSPVVSPLLVIHAFPVSFFKHMSKWKSKICDHFFHWMWCISPAVGKSSVPRQGEPNALVIGFFFNRRGCCDNNYISHLPKSRIRRDILGTCLKESGEARFVSL